MLNFTQIELFVHHEISAVLVQTCIWSAFIVCLGKTSKGQTLSQKFCGMCRIPNAFKIKLFFPICCTCEFFLFSLRVEKLGFLKSPSLIPYFAELWGESFKHNFFVGQRGTHDLWLNCLFSRKRNVVCYITILFAAVVLSPRPSKCIWNKLNLFNNASLCSDFFPICKTFFESLISSDFLLLLG